MGIQLRAETLRSFNARERDVEGFSIVELADATTTLRHLGTLRAQQDRIDESSRTGDLRAMGHSEFNALYRAHVTQPLNDRAEYAAFLRQNGHRYQMHGENFEKFYRNVTNPLPEGFRQDRVLAVVSAQGELLYTASCDEQNQTVHWSMTNGQGPDLQNYAHHKSHGKRIAEWLGLPTPTAKAEPAEPELLS